MISPTALLTILKHKLVLLMINRHVIVLHNQIKAITIKYNVKLLETSFSTLSSAVFQTLQVQGCAMLIAKTTKILAVRESLLKLTVLTLLLIISA